MNPSGANVPKDLYLKIAEMSDDRTVLNMLRTNKNFYDEKYFHQLLEKKYPLLLKFKDSQNWKDFYIRMVYYLSLLSEPEWDLSTFLLQL